MAVYFSKKDKAAMRQRKRKKEKVNGGVNNADATTTSETNDQTFNGDDDSTTKQSGKKRSAEQMISSSNGHVHDDHDSGDESNNNNINSKRAKIVGSKQQSLTIIVPSKLNSKEAKKFRKDERRKARLQGIPDDKLKFITEGQQNSNDKHKNSNNNGDDNDSNDNDNDNPNKSSTNTKTKPKKSFPRINDLLTQHANQQKLDKETKKRNAALDAIPPTEKQKYIAIDCEMVGVGTDGIKSVLARASVVNWEGTVLLDTFVRVPERVTDFRTFVSGVRPKDIAPKNENAMDPETVRKTVGELLMNKILVGHALKNDLAALMISHPRHEIRDTAKYKPFMRATGRSGGKLRPRKLRDLVLENLGMRIQVEGEAHCSVDDARASMELFKCVRNRWEKELAAKGGGGGGGKSRGKK